MAEEEKKAEEKKESCESSGGLKTFGKMLIGAILIVLGGYLCYVWRSALLDLVKGCVGLFLILVGLVFIAIAKE